MALSWFIIGLLLSALTPSIRKLIGITLDTFDQCALLADDRGGPMIAGAIAHHRFPGYWKGYARQGWLSEGPGLSPD